MDPVNTALCRGDSGDGEGANVPLGVDGIFATRPNWDRITRPEELERARAGRGRPESRVASLTDILLAEGAQRGSFSNQQRCGALDRRATPPGHRDGVLPFVGPAYTSDVQPGP